MFKNNNKRKAIALSLGLAALTLTANNLNAQNDGGLFGRGVTSDNAEYSSREGGVITVSSSTGGGFTNGYFGEGDPNPVPLGNGIAILIGAGLGYVALKKKEDKQ